MNNDTRYTGRASLAIVGQYVGQLGIWEMIEETVSIQQKVIRDRPIDKLKDCFISILAGGRGLVEVNTRLRPDRGLQAAFGRARCAEQSVISTTLNRCTGENVAQMRQVLGEIYRRHSEGYRHHYGEKLQVLDIDLSGLPAGAQGEGVTKGYFSGQKQRRGRQLGRVVASLYDEIVAEGLYAGRQQLRDRLIELVERAEAVLELDEERRQQTLLRIDSGGGSDRHVNALLEGGYQVLVKMYSHNRAAKLAQQVSEWVPDDQDPQREMGWLPQPHPYLRPTRQVAVRVPKAKGGYAYGVLICTASTEQLEPLLTEAYPTEHPHRDLLTLVHVYDRRGGAAETQFKGDKQGLGLTKRNKAAFAAQEMLTLLAQLAHNLIIWTRARLRAVSPRFQRLGILRMVRDGFHTPGLIVLDDHGLLIQVILSQTYPLAHCFIDAFSAPLSPLSLNLGKI